VSGFIKRTLLAMVASKLQRMAYRRGHNPAMNAVLRHLDHRLGHRRSYGHQGHYRYHGHYRRKHW